MTSLNPQQFGEQPAAPAYEAQYFRARRMERLKTGIGLGLAAGAMAAGAFGLSHISHDQPVQHTPTIHPGPRVGTFGFY